MLKRWLSYGLVITGSCLSAAAFGLIVLPQDFVAGGVTGLSKGVTAGGNRLRQHDFLGHMFLLLSKTFADCLY